MPPALAFLLFLVGPLMAIGVGVDFPFDRVQGTYENVNVETLPRSTGGFDLQLSSPENTVTLESGNLYLEPAEDGQHMALLEVIFEGEGELITEVKLGTLPARFEDHVRFPRQEHTVKAWVTIEAEEDGYRVVLKELPETIKIKLESSRARDLESLCRSMSVFFAGGDAGCEKLGTMLSNPVVPLPKTGSDYLVPYSSLTESERERMAVYRAASGF